MSEVLNNLPSATEAPSYEQLLSCCSRGYVFGPVLGARISRLYTEWHRLFPTGHLGFDCQHSQVKAVDDHGAMPEYGNAAWDRVLELLLTGLSSPPSDSVPGALLSWLQSPDWETRAAGQLALAFHWRGMGGGAATKGWQIFEEEYSPYAKVCACWIPALAVMQQQRSKFHPELHFEDPSSFNRDAAALAYGFSMWRTANFAPLLGLLDDPHQYVRETACVAIGLACEGTAHSTATQILLPLCSDQSEIVRTGAFLALGLIHFGRRETFEYITPRIPQTQSPTEQCCLWIAHGLAGVIDNSSPQTSFPAEISLGRDIQRFLCSSANRESRAMRRSLLPVLYYGALGSFWWGLWLIGMPGLCVARRHNVLDSWPRPPEAPYLSNNAAVVYHFLQGLRGKFEVQRLVTQFTDGHVESADFGIGLEALACYDVLCRFARVAASRDVFLVEVHGRSVLQTDTAGFRLNFRNREVLLTGTVLPTIEQDIRRLFSGHGFRLTSLNEPTESER